MLFFDNKKYVKAKIKVPTYVYIKPNAQIRLSFKDSYMMPGSYFDVQITD